MADFLEKRGLGHEVDPNEVNLSTNDLARLSRIRNMDPTTSSYPGSSVLQAQEVVSELPSAADLGLVLEQNKQLMSAGGRGYAGNVHNLEGDQTPFDRIAEGIAQSSRPEALGIDGVPDFLGRGGDGNGGDSMGSGRDMDVMGPYSQEAFDTATKGTLGKGGLAFGAALGLGAPTALAGKFALASMMNPYGALAAMGSMAYGGLKDEALDNTLGKYSGTSLSDLDQEALAAHREKMAMMDEAEVPSASIAQARATAPMDVDIAQQTMDNIGFFGQMGRAGRAALGIAQGIGRDIAGGWGGASSLEALQAAMAKDPLAGPVAYTTPTFSGYGVRGDRNGGGEGGYGGNSTGSSAPGGEGRGPGSSAHGGHSAYGGGGGGRGATDGMGPGSDSGSDRSSSDSESGGSGSGGK